MRRPILLVTLFVVTFIAVPPTFAGGGGGCHNPEITDAKTTTVEMIGACYSPTIVRIAPGETVNWVNRDGFNHVVYGTGWGEGKALGMGDSFSHRFDRPGIYPYSCFYHAGMNGAVVVGDSEQAVAVAAPKTVHVASTVKSPPPLQLFAINFVIAVAALVVAMRRRRAKDPN